MFTVLRPEICLTLDPRTERDDSRYPPVVFRLRVVFHALPTDALVACHPEPVFAASTRLRHEVARQGLTGITFERLRFTRSAAVRATHGRRGLPLFRWAHMLGEPGRDDFGLHHRRDLVVSARALDALRAVGLHRAAAQPFDTALLDPGRWFGPTSIRPQVAALLARREQEVRTGPTPKTRRFRRGLPHR